jgi:hypothetical protein
MVYTGSVSEIPLPMQFGVRGLMAIVKKDTKEMPGKDEG